MVKTCSSYVIREISVREIIIEIIVLKTTEIIIYRRHHLDQNFRSIVRGMPRELLHLDEAHRGSFCPDQHHYCNPNHHIFGGLSGQI